MGRLLLLLLMMGVAAEGCWAAPATTTISDTVYRADGSPASGGTLLISWPAFISPDQYPVAAGSKAMTLGAQGQLSVELVPNAAGSFYTVVYQLQGAVRTEYWVVPTTSPATIAEVRTTLGATGVAQMASRQYVDTAVASKAADAEVVHLGGSEVIGGVKQFAAPPYVPTPLQPTDAANKAYVDEAVAVVGAGSYVSKAGDTMSGPLQLSGDPTAPNHASTRHYVDSGLLAKANLTGGLVPPAELGNGAANGTMCLKGDSTWGACGTSSNAAAIQNVPVDPVAPADNQVITYEAASGTYKPKAGGGVTAGMQAVKYATDFNWTQSPLADLSTPGAKTVNLALCPAGTKASEPEYYVYIAGTGTPEAVKVTGGTCNGDGAAGTLQFTTANAHTAGYTMGSASGGLQEALIAARFTPTNPTGGSQSGRVIVPPGELRAYARISIRASNLTVDFSGSIVECYMNDACILAGDGYTLRFYLSQAPFGRGSRTLLEEEYQDDSLDAARWSVSDPGGAVSVSGGKLQISGGTGSDGETTVCFAEKIELGGATVMQHGDTSFTAASDGVMGGLYAGELTVSGCLAGFRITPSGSQSKIQALVNGTLSGAAITTQTGHRYAFTTRLYATETQRRRETFHSAKHPAGQGRGGGTVTADIRLVLEVHEIDPADPGTHAAPSVVLYDGVARNAPVACTYGLVNARRLYCGLAFTRLMQAVDAEVRSALPGQGYRTRLAGPLVEGAECLVSGEPALQFFPQSVPQANELIQVRYRGGQRALARVADAVSIAAHKRGNDDGVRGAVRYVERPAARSSADCENAALALLDDGKAPAWRGAYETWSDLLPGGAGDIFPGDGVEVNAASRGAAFSAIVREVEVEEVELSTERMRYRIRFAEDAAEALALETEGARASSSLDLRAVDVSKVGASFLASLSGAEITAVTSTTVTADAGVNAPGGGGFEVRRSDYGWGQENDRNLIGRFGSRSFTLPRLARVQDYFVRQYDGSNPAKYSRYSAALHVDYPL